MYFVLKKEVIIMAAEFTIVSQWLDSNDSQLGPISEELRTLQVKRPAAAVRQMQIRAQQWQRFGAAKGKIGPERGITDVLKEEIVIEEPSVVWEVEEDDKIAQRLVSTVGRMTISGSGMSRYNSAPISTNPGSHSRKNSLTEQPPSISTATTTTTTKSSGHSRSNSGAMTTPAETESSLPDGPL